MITSLPKWSTQANGKHRRAVHVRRRRVQLRDRPAGVVAVHQRQPRARGRAQDRAGVDPAELDRDEPAAAHVEHLFEQPHRLDERPLVNLAAAERLGPLLGVVEALRRDRAAVADGEQHLLRASVESGTQPISSPSRTSSWSCRRSTMGSPPPEALMKFAPRRKSSASVSCVNLSHGRLLLSLGSTDLVGQLVPALPFPDLLAQPEAARLRRFVERCAQLVSLRGDVRLQLPEAVERPGQRAPQTPVVRDQPLEVVEVDVVAEAAAKLVWCSRIATSSASFALSSTTWSFVRSRSVTGSVGESSSSRGPRSILWHISNTSTKTSSLPWGPWKISRRSPCKALKRGSGSYPAAARGRRETPPVLAAGRGVEVAERPVQLLA
jgi:hypothetical protein